MQAVLVCACAFSTWSISFISSLASQTLWIPISSATAFPGVNRNSSGFSQALWSACACLMLVCENYCFIVICYCSPGPSQQSHSLVCCASQTVCSRKRKEKCILSLSGKNEISSLHLQALFSPVKHESSLPSDVHGIPHNIPSDQFKQVLQEICNYFQAKK